jgi:UDP-glucose 4-epimerase
VRSLVTGGAGFIGSTLVDRLLAEGHAVDVLDNLAVGGLANLADARADRTAELKIHQVDIRSPETVELIARRRPDVVFHLAAVDHVEASLTAPAADADVNVVGSLHVIEGARRAGARKLVFASSAAVYGEPDPAALPVRESHPQDPLTPHGVGKRAVTDYLRTYRERHGLEFTSLALGSVYGPRQRSDGGVVAAFAHAMLAGETCSVGGDGTQSRDFVFVDDVVDALVRAGERGSGLLVNVGTGVETSIADLYRTMAEPAGAGGVPPVGGPRPVADVQRMVLDATRAKIQLGWQSWTSLAEGVAQTLTWVSRLA